MQCNADLQIDNIRLTVSRRYVMLSYSMAWKDDASTSTLLIMTTVIKSVLFPLLWRDFKQYNQQWFYNYNQYKQHQGTTIHVNSSKHLVNYHSATATGDGYGHIVSIFREFGLYTHGKVNNKMGCDYKTPTTHIKDS